MEKIEKAIEFVKSRKEDYDNPGSYQEQEYYTKCSNKSEILEEVLSFLEYLKKEK